MVSPTKAAPLYPKMFILKHTSLLAFMARLLLHNGRLINHSNLHQVLHHPLWEELLDGIVLLLQFVSLAYLLNN